MRSVLREIEGSKIKCLVSPCEYLPPSANYGGYVYFIRCMSSDLPVKIGHARDISRQFAALQSANPYELIVLAYYWHVDPAAEERLVHQHYTTERIRGKWFGISVRLEARLLELQRLCQTTDKLDEPC